MEAGLKGFLRQSIWREQGVFWGYRPGWKSCSEREWAMADLSGKRGGIPMLSCE